MPSGAGQRGRAPVRPGCPPGRATRRRKESSQGAHWKWFPISRAFMASGVVCCSHEVVAPSTDVPLVSGVPMATKEVVGNPPHGPMRQSMFVAMCMCVTSSTKKNLNRSWGYLLLVVLGYAWFGTAMAPVVIVVLSALMVLYMLFQAPMWCCAETRGHGLCRNNAYGLLMGCHLRQHKWQKLRMAFRYSTWGKVLGQVLSSVGGKAATVSALAGSASALAALGNLALK